ncbi:MAG: methionyl-tRNA formyltransferase, partial [Comamonas sp.]
DDTTASLHDKLAELGGRLIVEALELAACGGLNRTPQPAEGVTYAHKIEKAESLIDWNESAELIARRLRAFNPFPGGATSLGSEAIKVWEARAEEGSGAAGTVLSADAQGVRVACGSGVLNMTLLQRAGGKRLAAGDFLRGFELPAGAVLGSAAA